MNILSIRNIEVLYKQIILALKGVRIAVPKGSIVAILGANGAGKTTTLKACSNLLHTERGAVTHGSVLFQGEDIANKMPHELVKRGLIQVLEGRRCFSRLTVEENLLTGSSVRRGATRAELNRDLQKMYEEYFPVLKRLRKNVAGLTSGGEQQMIALGRALMARPKMVLLDEPSMGLAPRFVEQVFQIIEALNEKEGVSFLIAEQNAAIALRYAHRAYIIENGEVVTSGGAAELSSRSNIREIYLGMGQSGRTSFRDVKSYTHRRTNQIFF